MSSVVNGSLILVKINGQVYNECHSVSWNIGNSLREVFGIDTSLPQEIIQGQSTVTGNIVGLAINFSGGLQGIQATPLVSAIFSAPYISIRVLNRFTGESLLFVPNAQIGDQNTSVVAKGIMNISFSFKGLVAYQVLDEV